MWQDVKGVKKYDQYGEKEDISGKTNDLTKAVQR